MINYVTVFLSLFPKKNIKKEADPFKSILNWVNHGKSERKAGFAKLFGHVTVWRMS